MNRSVHRLTLAMSLLMSTFLSLGGCTVKTVPDYSDVDLRRAEALEYASQLRPPGPDGPRWQLVGVVGLPTGYMLDFAARLPGSTGSRPGEQELSEWSLRLSRVLFPRYGGGTTTPFTPGRATLTKNDHNLDATSVFVWQPKIGGVPDYSSWPRPRATIERQASGDDVASVSIPVASRAVPHTPPAIRAGDTFLLRLTAEDRIAWRNVTKELLGPDFAVEPPDDDLATFAAERDSTGRIGRW